MGIATGIVLYLVYWWIVFLMCLPWGVKISSKTEIGHASSAPSNPRLREKALATTLISAVLLGITAFGIAQRWVVLDI